MDMLGVVAKKSAHLSGNHFKNCPFDTGTPALSFVSLIVFILTMAASGSTMKLANCLSCVDVFPGQACWFGAVSGGDKAEGSVALSTG